MRRIARASSHGVREKVLADVFARHHQLSDEQKSAIEHVAGTARIAAVVGRAGAGKTTMMKAARDAWETAGYRVVGGALAGKAAEGLEKEAGIASHTLASWELHWKDGRDLPDDQTVFVLDEAGMVASRQMAGFIEAVTKAGAKLVLVGDPEQLQPIEAGAAFRGIADQIGYAELGIIYRQREAWMRRASTDLAGGRIGAALAAYDSAGMVRSAWSRDEAITSLIEDWDRDYDPMRTALILAHRRADVRLLNERARGKLVERGFVGKGFAFQTEDGPRNFAAGDHIVFLKNDGSLGVKNGMLAKVVDAAPGWITAEIGAGEERREVVVEQRFYANLDHGYATTIHKSQGATVDSVKVLASRTLDRHLTYVALTRHRDDAQLYAALNEYTNRGGILVDHGVAPYDNNPENRDSYFVTLETAEGKQNTIWGVDLERAIKEAAAKTGDRIGLEHNGSEAITLPDGQDVQRHSWKVIDVRELALSRLAERLSRDGSKCVGCWCRVAPHAGRAVRDPRRGLLRRPCAASPWRQHRYGLSARCRCRARHRSDHRRGFRDRPVPDAGSADRARPSAAAGTRPSRRPKGDIGFFQWSCAAVDRPDRRRPLSSGRSRFRSAAAGWSSDGHADCPARRDRPSPPPVHGTTPVRKQTAGKGQCSAPGRARTAGRR